MLCVDCVINKFSDKVDTRCYYLSSLVDVFYTSFDSFSYFLENYSTINDNTNKTKQNKLN